MTRMLYLFVLCILVLLPVEAGPITVTILEGGARVSLHRYWSFPGGQPEVTGSLCFCDSLSLVQVDADGVSGQLAVETSYAYSYPGFAEGVTFWAPTGAGVLYDFGAYQGTSRLDPPNVITRYGLVFSLGSTADPVGGGPLTDPALAAIAGGMYFFNYMLTDPGPPLEPCESASSGCPSATYTYELAAIWIYKPDQAAAFFGPEVLLSATATPEPLSAATVAGGLLCLALGRARRRRRAIPADGRRYSSTGAV
nr:hypothetical protein [uncultured Paludibaculum sp.]